ncbi:SHOCT domain-containing protein [Virgibacillus sp. FSP13]
MFTFDSFSSRLVFSIIILIILLFIIYRFRAGKNSASGSLDLMKERLEKGEISQEDYDEAKRRQGK